MIRSYFGLNQDPFALRDHWAHRYDTVLRIQEACRAADVPLLMFEIPMSRVMSLRSNSG